MARRTQDHLHRLVRSMTAAEKRYYKTNVARQVSEGSEALHNRLFDAISAMEHYDEALILERFKDTSIAHHFPITKRRLYESVLRYLSSYHLEGSIDAKLHRGLHQVEVLHGRTLYDDAAKVLHGIRRLATEHQRFVVLQAVMEWERKLVECNNYTQLDAQALQRMTDESERILEQQRTLNTLWDLKSNVFLQLYQEGRVRDDQDCDALRQLLQHPLLQQAELLTGAHARFLFHHIHGAAAFSMGDVPRCMEQLEKNLDLLNNERHLFKGDPNLIISVLSNLIYVCVQAGRYARASDLLKRFRTIPSEWDMPETEDLELKLFSTTTSLELSIHLRTGETELALELVPVVVRGLERHEQRISPLRKAAFHYQLAYVHFCCGRYEEALHWTNLLLTSGRSVEKSDAMLYGRYLYLVLLLESGKHDLLAFAMRNTERLLKVSAPHHYGNALLSLLKGLLRARSADSRHGAFEEFAARIRAFRSDPREQAIFDHFDPLAWAESHLQGGSFAARIKQRSASVDKAA